METENEELLRLLCYILESDYIEKQGYKGLNNEELEKKHVFPQFWYEYSPKYRIEVLNDALEENVSLEEIIYRKRVQEYQKR